MNAGTGQSRHSFQKSLFCSVYTETQPQNFLTKTGSVAFAKVLVSEGRKHQSSVNDRCYRGKSYEF